MIQTMTEEKEVKVTVVTEGETNAGEKAETRTTNAATDFQAVKVSMKIGPAPRATIPILHVETLAIGAKPPDQQVAKHNVVKAANEPTTEVLIVQTRAPTPTTIGLVHHAAIPISHSVRIATGAMHRDPAAQGTEMVLEDPMVATVAEEMVDKEVVKDLHKEETIAHRFPTEGLHNAETGEMAPRKKETTAPRFPTEDLHNAETGEKALSREETTALLHLLVSQLGPPTGKHEGRGPVTPTTKSPVTFEPHDHGTEKTTIEVTIWGQKCITSTPSKPLTKEIARRLHPKRKAQPCLTQNTSKHGASMWRRASLHSACSRPWLKQHLRSLL